MSITGIPQGVKITIDLDAEWDVEFGEDGLPKGLILKSLRDPTQIEAQPSDTQSTNRRCKVKKRKDKGVSYVEQPRSEACIPGCGPIDVIFDYLPFSLQEQLRKAGFVRKNKKRR